MKVHGFAVSNYHNMVRMALMEKGAAFETVEVFPNQNADYLARSPMGKVPCLVMEGAEALFDSHVIVEYLDALSPVGKLIPSVGRERAGVKTWEALADGVLDAAILARLEATWTGRSAEQRSSAWIDRQLSKVHAAVQAMSKGLGEQAFCSGVHFSLSDISVGVALGYLDFRFPEIDWRRPHPNLHKLFDKLMQRPSFADTLPP